MATQVLGGEKVFLRKASGLIKSANTSDVFVYNTGLVSIGIGVATLVLYSNAVYPGAQIVGSALIAGAVMTLIALGMLAWTVTLPRSGGVYVFSTRSLWPPLAFVVSFVEIAAWLFYDAVAAFWITVIGIVPALTTVGILSGNTSFTNLGRQLNTPGGEFVIGTVILILSGLLLASGMRKFFLVQKITFTIGMLGIGLLAIILLFASHNAFVHNFNGYMRDSIPGANPYQEVIRRAVAAGWHPQGSSLYNTWLLSIWAFLALIGSAFSIAIGGEIRQVVRGQTIGIFGALVLSTVAFMVVGQLSVNVFGYNFLGAVTYDVLNNVSHATTPTTPWITLLVALLTKNVWLALFINLSFMCWIWLWIPGMQIYGERATIAWAFDRIAPDRLGYVSDRTHTPVVAIVVVTLVCIVFMALYVFTPVFQTVIMIEAAVVAWGIVLLAGVWFPFRMRHLYEKSPLAPYKILGLPIMSVVCGAGAIAAAFAFWMCWNDSFAAGHSTTSLLVMGMFYLLGLLFFGVMYYLRKRQNINVYAAFREIPIE